MRNPFEYGRELAEEELVDRQAELRQLETAIRNRSKLFLIGPRRFGKTSLLHAAATRAERSGTLVLRVDAEKYETLPLLAQALLTLAARGLRTPAERLATWLSEVAGRLRPRIMVDSEGNLSIGLDTQVSDALPVLADALDAIEALARKADRPIVVILDEVQQVVVEHGAAAERQLRATVQRHTRTGYIFAGSSVRLLTAMTSDANRPFYRLGERLFLDAIPRTDFRAFITGGFLAAHYPVAEEGVTAILDLADDVPYNVQRLAYELWEMLRAGEAASVTRATAQQAVARIVRREDTAYTYLWTQLSQNRKKALKAVIEHEGENLQSAEITASHGISASSMQASLAALESAHVVRRASTQGRVRYRLVDPFLAEWLNDVQSP